MTRKMIRWSVRVESLRIPPGSRTLEGLYPKELDKNKDSENQEGGAK